MAAAQALRTGRFRSRNRRKTHTGFHIEKRTDLYTLSVTFSVADPVNNNTGGNGGINPPQQNNISVTFNVSGTRSDLLGCIKVIGSAEGQETGVSTYGSAVNIFNSDFI